MKDFKDRVFVSKLLGKVYGVPKPCCLVCRYCSDIWVDYTGPWQAFCGIGVEPEDKNEEQNCCDKFKVDDEAYILMEDFQKMSIEEKNAYVLRKMSE